MFPQIFYLFRFISASIPQKFPDSYRGPFVVLFSSAVMATPSDLTKSEVIVSLNYDCRNSICCHEETLNLGFAGPDHCIYADDNKTKQTVLAKAKGRTGHFSQSCADKSFCAVGYYGAPMISPVASFPIFSQSTESWVFPNNRSEAAHSNTAKVVENGSDLSGCTTVPIPASSTALWKSQSAVCRIVLKLLFKTQDGKYLHV